MEQFKGSSTGSMLSTAGLLLVVMVVTQVANWRSAGGEPLAFFVALAVAIGVFFALFLRSRRGSSWVSMGQALLLAVPVLIASIMALVGAFRRRSRDGQSAPADVSAPVASEPSEKLQNIRAGAIRALTMLKDVLPKLVWQALKSAFVTGVLGGLAGFVVAALVWLIDRSQTFAAWLHVVQLVVVPLVFFLAGVYVGAFRGFLAALVDTLRERALAQYLYDAAKPMAVAAVSRLEGKASPSKRQLARALYAEGQSMFAAGRVRASEVGDSLRKRGSRVRFGIFRRLQQRVSASIFSRVLTVALLPSGEPTRAELVNYYETLGVERLEEALGQSVTGLFAAQRWVVVTLALVTASAPYAIALLTAP